MKPEETQEEAQGTNHKKWTQLTYVSHSNLIISIELPASGPGAAPKETENEKSAKRFFRGETWATSKLHEEY